MTYARNSWLTALGLFKTPTERKQSDAERARRYRARHRERLILYWRERNAARKEYFKLRDRKRTKYFAKWQREYRAANA